MIKRVKQPTNWSCWAAVCAMITGKTCEDFFEFTGHDGGGGWDNLGVIIDGAMRSGFIDAEAYAFLLRHGARAGTTFTGEHTPMEAENWHDFEAIMYVASERYEGATHMVYWDGTVVHDPNPNALDCRSIDEYTVKWYEQVLRFHDDARWLSVCARVNLSTMSPSSKPGGG